jgi:hypothetical protein
MPAWHLLIVIAEDSSSMNTPTNLNTRLAQYDATARGEATRGRSIGEIAGFAAAAGAGLATAGAADAAIIYSGVQNISVAINPAKQAAALNFSTTAGISIDLDGGGADVALSVGFSGNLTAGSDSVKYVGLASMSATGGAAFLGTTTAGNGFFKLAASANVGPGRGSRYTWVPVAWTFCLPCCLPCCGPETRTRLSALGGE